jgi:DNA (cytosine-5)-methyltransferase 1
MIKVGSDFSGVGAFNQALNRLGITYEEVFACDMDKYARQTFIENYGEPKYYPTDVYEREIPVDPLTIYMSSPPCQAFSLAGKRKGKEDLRGILFFNSLEFIQKNKPRYFIFENVKGLLSDDAGNTFNEWLNYLGGKSINGNAVMFPYQDSVPYHIYWKVLNAKNFGVPQNRERVFIVGIRDDSDNQFKFPKEFTLDKKLKDILEPEVLEKFTLSENAIFKCMKSQANKDILIKEVPDISKCIVAGYYKITFDGQYIKVNSNLEKYYVSEKMLDTMLVAKNRNDKAGNGFGFKVKDEEETANCITTGVGKMRNTDNFLPIKSANADGFEIAKDGDTINYLHPNSNTRRGRVGKQVAQTLDTGCNQVVVYNIKRLNETIEKHDLKPGEIKMLDTYNKTIHDDCPTLKARENDDKKLWTGFKIRRLTPRECFRLMDFPDTFTWSVSDTQAYKQAGNSIVVSCLYHIIKNLKLEK